MGYQIPLPLVDGRSTGMYACVTKSSLRRSGSSPDSDSARDKLSGYADAQKYAQNALGLDPSSTINACHLIGDSLGGSGDDQQSLATCFRGVNSFDRTPGDRGYSNMASMEGLVRAAARQGQSVSYTVIPYYASDESKVPYAFELSAEGVYSNGATGLYER